MKPVANADSFLLECRSIRSNYDSTFLPQISRIREKYRSSLPSERRAIADALLQQALESHLRTYIINGLLAALNWRMNLNLIDGLPNLIPEVPVRSQKTQNIRYLDYLGLERETNRPLLLVETKRPSSALPTLANRVDQRPTAISEIVSRGLSGERLAGEWSQWIVDLRDYVRTVASRGAFPARVLITNGEWMIVFLDPFDSFAEAGNRDFAKILVFEKPADIEARAGELFTVLAHKFVVGKAPYLTLGQIPFELVPKHLEGIMHGLRLRYLEQQQVYELSPKIFVAPVIFLQGRNGSWIRVEAPPDDFPIPSRPGEVDAHLVEVEDAARQLVSSVESAINVSLRRFSLEEHYSDGDSFDSVRGVAEQSKDEFLLATGTNTHYLLREASVPDCPYHEWSAARRDGAATEPVMLTRSTKPRSFFVTGELHHCAHSTVADAKCSPITEANRARCGPRSGSDGHAFCEIFRFETQLCCRTCAFESVCTKAEVFRVLPCRR